MPLNMVGEGTTALKVKPGVPETRMVAVPVLLAVLGSLAAPVATVTVDEPAVVGAPETGHVMEALGATVAGGAGEQIPTVNPTGRPLMLQVALVAAAVAEAPLVHLIVPE
jgi:hypothetical protein